MRLQRSTPPLNIPAAAPRTIQCTRHPAAAAPQRQLASRQPKQPLAMQTSLHRSKQDADTLRTRVPRPPGSLPRGEGVPEDVHHSPQETPEQWLLMQEHAEHAKQQPGQPQQQQTIQGSKGRKMTVPYLGLEVTPELVAISMGA
jgi:hypothetical protein